MNKKTISITALVLIVISLIGYIAYSFDFDKAVQVNLSNIYIDDDYLKERSIPYDTTGKKIVSCDIEIKNHSFFEFRFYEIYNDSIIPLYADNYEECISIIPPYSKIIIPASFVADENDDIDEIEKQLLNSKIKILKYLQKDGDDAADFSFLYVDKVND